MQVNHGGLDAGVAEKVLDLAKGHAGLEQVRGIAMPQEVGMHAAIDASGLGSPTQSGPRSAFQRMPTDQLEGDGMLQRLGGGEQVLPLQAARELWELAGKCIGEIYRGAVVVKVLPPEFLAGLEMGLKVSAQGMRDWQAAVLVSFALADQEDGTIQVQILNTQIQKFCQSQTAPVLESVHEAPLARAVIEKPAHLLRRNDMRKPLAVMRGTLGGQLEGQE